jgi:L-ribulose-5-phosphate 4-epimerase
MLGSLKERVLKMLMELPKNDLVCLTSGNVSARDPESGLVVIKPSGVPYMELDTDALVVLDMEGKVVEGKLKPSSDTASHLYIYRHMSDIMGITHTHSPYATAFAAAAQPVPVYFSETAEEFGGEIPCSEFVLIGDQAIGEQVVKYAEKVHAVILKKHGLFTIGESPEKAVNLAILAENSAYIAWLSLQIGKPLPIPEEDIKALYYRQQNIYGQ